MKKLMTFITLSAVAVSIYAAGMLPHHIGAVKMAEVELKYGKDPEMRKLAENIINAQQAEIEQMQKWLEAHNKGASRSLHPR